MIRWHVENALHIAGFSRRNRARARGSMDPPAKQKTHMEYRSAVSRLEAAIARGKIKFEEIEDETEPFDPNTQYPWEEEIREFWPTKPCTWCKEPTQKGCDFCAAQDRFPSLSWEKHHPTPVCDRCQNYHGQCYVCREEGYPDLPFRTVSCIAISKRLD